jgi:hypothetical protein
MGWVMLICIFGVFGLRLRQRQSAGGRRELMRQSDSIWLERVRPTLPWPGRHSAYVLHDPTLPGGERSYADDRLAAMVAFEIALAPIRRR